MPHLARLSQATARRFSAASRSRFVMRFATQRAMKAATAARAQSESDITVSPSCSQPSSSADPVRLRGAGLPAPSHPVPAIFFRTTPR